MEPKDWPDHYRVRPELEALLELCRDFALKLDALQSAVSSRDTADAGGVWQRSVSADQDGFFNALIQLGISHQATSMELAKMLHPEWWEEGAPRSDQN